MAVWWLNEFECVAPITRVLAKNKNLTAFSWKCEIS